MMQLGLPDPASDWTLRWRSRRTNWRPPGDVLFEPAGYEIAEIEKSRAQAFVAEHHYSLSYPSDRLRYGLFRRGGQLVGVAALTNPQSDAVVKRIFPDLVPLSESLELGRFVLLDDVPANGESWFLARIWTMAARAGIRGVVSFSDPVPRPTLPGRPVMPGHIGLIYQASNAAYLGRTRARRKLLLPDGREVPERAISKMRNMEQGGSAWICRLNLLAGVPLPGQLEGPARWVEQALRRLTRLQHGGCHRYAFVLGPANERRALRKRLPVAMPYPKKGAA